jgi:DeoR family transcriptional regulator, glycerol-3-phosphate regulon repressor
MVNSAQTRRKLILDEIFARRTVTVVDLASATEASEATIRRDLKSLADEGEIDLVYGGASIRRSSDFSFRSKHQRNIEAKELIGRLATSLVRDDDQIFLDSGTTCFKMAPILKRKRGLSIITNSARLAIELDAPNTHVILIGGQYRPDRMDCVGPIAASTFDQLRGYVCFVGADGLSVDFGPSANDVESAHFNRQAVQNSREAILLVDHSKFSAPSLFKIVDWEFISRVVTDVCPSQEWMTFFEGRGVSVIYPGSLPLETANSAEGDGAFS